LPDKNVGVKLRGKLLFEWTAQAALDSGVYDKIVVISNGEKVKERASRMDGITFMWQPIEVAHPTATSESVLLYVLDELEKQGERYDWITLLQITSPLRDARDCRGAWEQVQRSGADTIITAMIETGFHWDRWTGWPIDFDPLDREPTCERENRVREMGAIYTTRVPMLRQSLCRVNGKVDFYIMPSWKNVSIDTYEDLMVAERLMGFDPLAEEGEEASGNAAG